MVYKKNLVLKAQYKMRRRKSTVAFLELLNALGQVSGLAQGVLQHLRVCIHSRTLDLLSRVFKKAHKLHLLSH